MSKTKPVDYNVMEKLHEIEREFEQNNLKLEVTGLEGHRKLFKHPLASRRSK